MFGNFKELLNVVQDGINSSANLRQTFSEVQKIKFNFGNKTQSRNYPVPLEAGSELLSRHQEQWAELHTGAELASAEADKLDRLITHTLTETDRRMTAISDLHQSLLSLPKLTSAMEDCIEQLTSIEELVLTVEADLQQFEDLVDRQRLHEAKMDQHRCLARYKDDKLRSLEQQRAALSRESSERHAARERQQMALLEARTESDLRLYRETGMVPARPTESTRSQTLTLEQVEIEEDKDDIEAFLNS